ncbi:MAG: class I SAM-dependent methyltransferase [Bryobacteraceae bacterium]
MEPSAATCNAARSMSACLVCGDSGIRRLFTATDRLYATTDREFEVVACTNCGLIRLTPQPPPEELSRYYPSNYWFSPDASLAARLEEAYRRVVLRDHVRFVSRAVVDSGETGPVLDVGCGGGLFPRMLRERGFTAIGLDAAQDAAAVAWRTNGVPVSCGHLDRAPLRAGTCAAVTMFHVLEHLYDPRAYLEAARLLLRPNGRLIAQVPNAGSWQFRLLGPRWNGVDVPRHLIDFRSRDLEKVMSAAGFTVVRRKYFSLRDNPAGLASSIAPALDPMARRVRGTSESSWAKLAKDLAYFTLVTGAVPFTILEASCGAGSTVMVEAKRTP